MRAVLIRNTIGALLMVAAASAAAQFVWIDASGIRQYSDRPPPASIPKNKILKEPSVELRSNRPAEPDTSATKASLWRSSP